MKILAKNRIRNEPQSDKARWDPGHARLWPQKIVGIYAHGFRMISIILDYYFDTQMSLPEWHLLITTFLTKFLLVQHTVSASRAILAQWDTGRLPDGSTSVRTAMTAAVTVVFNVKSNTLPKDINMSINRFWS